MRVFAVELNVDELQASKPDFFGFPWIRQDGRDRDELPSAIMVRCSAIDQRGSWLNFTTGGVLVLSLPAHVVYLVGEIADRAEHDWLCRDCGCEFDSSDKTDEGCPGCSSFRLVKQG